jgi:hypothetical protein
MNSTRRILEVAAELGVAPSVVELALDHSTPNRLHAVAVLLGQPAAELKRRAAQLDVDTNIALDWLVLAA